MIFSRKFVVILMAFAWMFAFSLSLVAQNYLPIPDSLSEAQLVDKAVQVRPSERQLKWQQLELTAFFHFGMNTFTNREWGEGQEPEHLFQPTDLDARQWVQTCRDAGIRQVILTVKHHDGFCLWPSEFTDHSVEKSPWKQGKGDVVREVSEACRELGVGFGIYLSPWDRTESTYGTEAYNDFFVDQLTELLTGYGPIAEVWFDGANGEGANGKRQEYDFERYYKVIRQLQPGAVIAIMGPDVRWVGTESGYGRETEWSVLPVDARSADIIAQNSQKDDGFAPLGDLMDSDLGSRNKLKNAKGLIWYPSETDVSIRPGWFYHPEEDGRVKSPEKLLDIYFSSVGRNSVLLLNLPPDTRGQLHPNDVRHLMEWRRLLDQTFAVNLAQSARLKSSNGAGLDLLTDGHDHTHFTANPSDTATDIYLNFPSSTTFDVLLLQENIREGQRIEGFVLEYKDKGQWKEIISGTTIGYKRLLRFEPVKAKYLRLRITACRQKPVLAELGLYKLPDKVAFSVRPLDKKRSSPPVSKAIGKPARLLVPPDPKYAKGGENAWNNGVFGSNSNFADGEWLGWSGGNFEAIIDFERKEKIRRVSLDYFHQPSSWIFMPSSVKIYFSNDGKEYRLAGEQKDFSMKDEGVGRVSFEVKGQARYIKILAANYGNIPSGYAGAGTPAWLFVDEVLVE